MKHFFIISVSAYNENSQFTHSIHMSVPTIWLREEINHDELEKLSLEVFPVSEGYFYHNHGAYQIDDGDMDKLIAEYEGSKNA
jgi:hypothetical protein